MPIWTAVQVNMEDQYDDPLRPATEHDRLRDIQTNLFEMRKTLSRIENLLGWVIGVTVFTAIYVYFH